MTLLAIKLFFSKAWAWLKAHWMWVLFPFGLAFTIFEVMSKFKRSPDVVVPELVGAAKKAADEEAIAEQKMREAETKRSKSLSEIEAKHLDVIQKMNEEQYKKVEELRGEPDKLNEYLLEVSKEMHGGTP